MPPSSSSSPGRRRIFWALALYRRRSTPTPVCRCCRHAWRGVHATACAVYTFILLACTLLPVAIGMSGLLSGFGGGAQRRVHLVRNAPVQTVQRRAVAKRTFNYSILYLSLCSPVLLIDHYAPFGDAMKRTLLVLFFLCSHWLVAENRLFPPGGRDRHQGYGNDFRLTDHTGKARSMADFRGKTVLMFLGSRSARMCVPRRCPI